MGMYNAAIEMSGLGSRAKPATKDTYAIVRRNEAAGVPSTHSH